MHIIEVIWRIKRKNPLTEDLFLPPPLNVWNALQAQLQCTHFFIVYQLLENFTLRRRRKKWADPPRTHLYGSSGLKPPSRLRTAGVRCFVDPHLKSTSGKSPQERIIIKKRLRVWEDSCFFSPAEKFPGQQVFVSLIPSMSGGDQYTYSDDSVREDGGEVVRCGGPESNRRTDILDIITAFPSKDILVQSRPSVCS